MTVSYQISKTTRFLFHMHASNLNTLRYKIIGTAYLVKTEP